MSTEVIDKVEVKKETEALFSKKRTRATKNKETTTTTLAGK